MKKLFKVLAVLKIWLILATDLLLPGKLVVVVAGALMRCAMATALPGYPARGGWYTDDVVQKNKLSCQLFVFVVDIRNIK